jgi:isoamylase
MLEFVRGMIALRRRHPSLMRNAFFTGKPMPGRDIPDIAWHGIRLNEPPWHDGMAQFLAFTIAGLTANEEDLHVMLNLADVPIEVSLPSMSGKNWYAVVDTSSSTTAGVSPPENQKPVFTTGLPVRPRSVVILEGRAGGEMFGGRRGVICG